MPALTQNPPQPMPDPELRLKTAIRVSAHLRRVVAAGSFAAVARRGDPDAGAVAVKVYVGDQKAQLFVQSRDIDGNTIWRDPFDGACEESKIDAFLKKETSIDPDLWIIDIEDREGRAFLE